MPLRDPTQAQALDWESTSGESLGEDRDNQRPPPTQLDVINENLAVQTDRVQNPRETVAVQDSEDQTLIWIQNQTRDDVQSERSDEHRENWRTKLVVHVPHSRTRPDYQGEVDFTDYITQDSDKETECVKLELREGFVFRCLAVLFLHSTFDEISFTYSYIWLIPGLVNMLLTPVTTLGTLWNCMHKMSALPAILGIFLMVTRDPMMDEKFYFISLLILKMHGVMRRLEVLPTILKLHGSNGTFWSSMWRVYCFAFIIAYISMLSGCLSSDDCVANDDNIRRIDNMLSNIHQAGICAVMLSVLTDGWNRYQHIEPLLNHNSVRRAHFACEYICTRVELAHDSIGIDYYLYFINSF